MSHIVSEGLEVCQSFLLNLTVSLRVSQSHNVSQCLNVSNSVSQCLKYPPRLVTAVLSLYKLDCAYLSPDFNSVSWADQALAWSRDKSVFVRVSSDNPQSFPPRCVIQRMDEIIWKIPLKLQIQIFYALNIISCLVSFESVLYCRKDAAILSFLQKI